MEPQAAPGPEQGPKTQQQTERVAVPEQSESPAPSQEKMAPRGESASQSAPTLPPTSLPRPVIGDDTSQAQSDQPKADDTQDPGPAVADDVDVIEKEWVDKAKSIVDEHKHDPYNQEKETSKLQADYLKKRYGKDVKLSP
jgi:hypothetical protein